MSDINLDAIQERVEIIQKWNKEPMECSDDFLISLLKNRLQVEIDDIVALLTEVKRLKEINTCADHKCDENYRLESDVERLQAEVNSLASLRDSSTTSRGMRMNDHTRCTPKLCRQHLTCAECERHIDLTHGGACKKEDAKTMTIIRNEEANCGNCPYWKNKEGTGITGSCHRRASSNHHDWPPRSCSDWCGEHPDFLLTEGHDRA